MQHGVHLARVATEERMRDAETQNRLSHLNRIGQTTQAYQILTDRAKNSKSQGKVLIKVALPENQSAMILQEPSASLGDLLRAIAAKRKLEATTLGLRLSESGPVLNAQALREQDVASLAAKEVFIVRLADVISRKKNKADAMRLLAAAASDATDTDTAANKDHVSAEVEAPGEDVFLEVNLPDGGQTVLKVAAGMSMGELLFYIAHKRDLDVSNIFLADTASGKRPVSMKGTVEQAKRKHIFVVLGQAPAQGPRRGTMSFSIRRQARRRSSLDKSADGAALAAANGVGAPTGRPLISGPTLQSSTRSGLAPRDESPPSASVLSNASAADTPQLGRRSSFDASEPLPADLQRVMSLLAEGAALADQRMPRPFVELVSRANVATLVERSDARERNFVMQLITRHGGVEALLSQSTAELCTLFAAANNVRKAGKVIAAERGPASHARRRSSVGPLANSSMAGSVASLRSIGAISDTDSIDSLTLARRRAPPPPPAAAAAAAGLAAAAIAARSRSARRSPSPTNDESQDSAAPERHGDAAEAARATPLVKAKPQRASMAAAVNVQTAAAHALAEAFRKRRSLANAATNSTHAPANVIVSERTAIVEEQDEMARAPMQSIPAVAAKKKAPVPAPAPRRQSRQASTQELKAGQPASAPREEKPSRLARPETAKRSSSSRTSLVLEGATETETDADHLAPVSAVPKTLPPPQEAEEEEASRLETQLRSPAVKPATSFSSSEESLNSSQKSSVRSSPTSSARPHDGTFRQNKVAPPAVKPKPMGRSRMGSEAELNMPPVPLHTADRLASPAAPLSAAGSEAELRAPLLSRNTLDRLAAPAPMSAASSSTSLLAAMALGMRGSRQLLCDEEDLVPMAPPPPPPLKPAEEEERRCPEPALTSKPVPAAAKSIGTSARPTSDAESDDEDDVPPPPPSEPPRAMAWAASRSASASSVASDDKAKASAMTKLMEPVCEEAGGAGAGEKEEETGPRGSVILPPPPPPPAMPEAAPSCNASDSGEEDDAASEAASGSSGDNTSVFGAPAATETEVTKRSVAAGDVDSGVTDVAEAVEGYGMDVTSHLIPSSLPPPNLDDLPQPVFDGLEPHMSMDDLPPPIDMDMDMDMDMDDLPPPPPELDMDTLPPPPPPPMPPAQLGVVPPAPAPARSAALPSKTTGGTKAPMDLLAAIRNAGGAKSLKSADGGAASSTPSSAPAAAAASCPRDAMMTAIRNGEVRARLKSVTALDRRERSSPQMLRQRSTSLSPEMRRSTMVGLDLQNALLAGMNALVKTHSIRSDKSDSSDREKRNSIGTTLANAMDARRMAMADEDDEWNDGSDTEAFDDDDDDDSV
jgi:hypothetical protein